MYIRLLSKRYAYGIGFLLFNLSLVNVPAGAGQRFHYAGLLGGVQVLDAYITVEMPEEKSGPYRVELEAVTSGSLAAIYPYKAQAEAQGFIHEGRVVPTQYASHAIAAGNEAGISLRYKKDGTISGVPTTIKNTLDPLSAFLATMQGEGAYCEGKIPVYDGVARYDLTLSSAGEHVFIAPQKTGPFTVGSLQQCLAQITVISGADPNLAKFGLIPQSLRLGRNEQTDPAFLPLQNAVILGIGEIEIRLME